jgi:hypothetical protein
MTDPTTAPDQLVPDPAVAREFGVTPMTIYRWDHDPRMAALGWPPAIKLPNTRNYRSRRRLEAFKAGIARAGLDAVRPSPKSAGARGRRSPKTATEPHKSATRSTTRG